MSTFADVDGGTLVTGVTVHGSIEARDRHVHSGMEAGMKDTLARLDELVAALRSA